MKIIFYGGRQAGLVSLLTLLSLKHDIVCVIPVDDVVESVAGNLGLNIQKPKNINEDEFVGYLKGLKAEAFICCHGRQIIKARILNAFKCINLHPCLYQYKGAEPIKRLLQDHNKRASVASHQMTETVDGGQVIVENFKEVESDTVVGVYNELYPIYAKTIIDTMEKI